MKDRKKIKKEIIKNKQKNFLTYFIVLFLALLVFVSGIFLFSSFGVSAMSAYNTDSGIFTEGKEYISINNADSYAAAGYEVRVDDSGNTYAVTKSIVRQKMDSIREILSFADKWADDDLGAKLYKNSLSYFLGNLAQDTATWIVNGNWGQSEYFRSDNFADYMIKIRDGTMGTVLETLGKENDWAKFNLCNPSFDVKFAIGLGLYQSARPKAPACTFAKMADNWEEAVNDPKFLENYQDMFNPWSNDLGIAWSIQTNVWADINSKQDSARQEDLIGQGWLSVTSGISGQKKTPAYLVGEYAVGPVNKGTKVEEVYTGNWIADSIDIFANTLAGKLSEKWFKKGLLHFFPEDELDPLAYNPFDYNAPPYNPGLKAASERFRDLAEPKFKEGKEYNILSELTRCPDVNKAGPTNCVITDNFSNAIEKKMTVGQALKEGKLDESATFGFVSPNKEPRHNEGYPYRSMIILRKYRILPVGWELAAQYISDNFDIVGKTKNLGDLVECFDPSDDFSGYNDSGNEDWCEGLIDPDWVLKAPENYCARQGFGPEILNSTVVGDSVSVQRNGKYCADDQTCIKEKGDGTCDGVYGYCVEERRKWNFASESCEPRYNTCQTFRSRAGKTVSFLENTLIYKVGSTECDITNVGCKKYSIAGSYTPSSVDASGVYTPAEIGWSANSMYFDKDKEECDEDSEGCHHFIRTNDEDQEEDVYLRLMPGYLRSSCYGPGSEANTTKTLDSAPDVCDDYVRECGSAELDCELYTSKKNSWSIPAIVEDANKCPAECVGYNKFYEQPTIFRPGNSIEKEFIPATAERCSSDAVGCSEFTNLDKIDQGGEALEYYSYLRQCVQPGANNCEEFYTWQGSDESGYQLKVFSFQTEGGSLKLTSADTYDEKTCTALTYEPTTNPMCWEFYDTEGNVQYAFFPYTIMCSEDCHPYRKTESTQTDCLASNGEWKNNACHYMAIPSQGIKCGAGYDGCMKYTGPTGGNMRNIFTHDFESGLGQWTGGFSSSEASTIGGHSMAIQVNPAELVISDSISRDSWFVLSFIAKSSGSAGSITASFVSSTTAEVSSFSVASGIEENWNKYVVNLEGIGHDIDGDEILKLAAGGGVVYVDNIKLTEVIDTYYLIKESWNTPDTCNSDMIGCDEYTDRANNSYYLKDFTKLCDRNAVGCELMTDTYNSTATEAETLPSGTVRPQVTVHEDRDVYVVYDSKKKCNVRDKGCELFGLNYVNEKGEVAYGDTWIKNNPDNYGTTLCHQDAVDCEEWKSTDGPDYFKDPGNDVCEWTQLEGVSGYGWYVRGTSTPCNVSQYETIGIGGRGNRIDQPIDKVGLCPASEAGCTEYIDPISSFSTNLIFNPTYADINGDGSFGDGWGSPSTIVLEANTLYRQKDIGINNDRNIGTGLLNCGKLSYLDLSDNTIKPIAVGTSVKLDKYKLIYVEEETPEDGKVECKIDDIYGSIDYPSELRKVSIEYQLRQKLDQGECNSIPNFDNGCVVFNERKTIGKDGYQLPTWDALASYAKESGTTGATNDVNKLIKVSPDRTCNTWLACRSFVQERKGEDPVCFDIGLCDSLDDNNQCANFVLAQDKNQAYSPLGLPGSTDTENWFNISGIYQNMSGFSAVQYKDSTFDADLYSLGRMKQEGEVAQVSNGNFEYYGSDKWPLGWASIDNSLQAQSWNNSKFMVVSDLDIQREKCFQYSQDGTCVLYAPEGHAMLKLYPANSIAASEFIDVEPGKEYVMNTWLNTERFSSRDVIGEATINGVAAYVEIITYGDDGKLTGNGLDFVYCENVFDPRSNGCGALLEKGKNWTNLTRKFKVGDSTKKLRVMIGGRFWYTIGGVDCSDSTMVRGSHTSSCGTIEVKLDDFAGSAIYVDDIKISPVLEVKDYCQSCGGGVYAFDCTNDYTKTNTACVFGGIEDSGTFDTGSKKIDYKMISQTCRLYPEDDALSCDYYDDDFKYQRGMWGYCLQNDRSPGDPNACLIWYPVDKVKGTGVEEGAGYAGRFPLYYATEVSDVVEIEFAAQADEEVSVIINGQYPYREKNGDYEFACSKHIIGRYIPAEIASRCVKSWVGGINGTITSNCKCIAPGNNEVVKMNANIKIGQNTIAIYGDEDEERGHRMIAFKAQSVSGGYIDTITTSDTENWRCLGTADTKELYGDKREEDDWNNGEGLGPLPADANGKYWWDYGYDDSTWEKPCIACGGGTSQIAGASPIYDQNSTDSHHASWCRYEFFAHPQANRIVQVVTPSGQNKFWAGRVSNGSDYEIDCNAGIDTAGKVCRYQVGEAMPVKYVSDYPPFGAAVPPANSLSMLSSPYDWDSREREDGKQPLYFEIPEESGNIARMGQLHVFSELKNIFAKSYGIWNWEKRCTGGINSKKLGELCVDDIECACTNPLDPTCSAGTCEAAYYRVDTEARSATCRGGVNNGNQGKGCADDSECGCLSAADCQTSCSGASVLNRLQCLVRCANCKPGYCEIMWNPPIEVCNGSSRGEKEYCAYVPEITNVRVNGVGGVINIIKNGIVNLTFNTQLDTQQLPLVMYAVDWGDGEETVISGVEMNHRQHPDNPHSLHHLYSYWDIMEKVSNGSLVSDTGSDICTDGTCTIKPRIKIMDNWGWCNNVAGATSNDCTIWVKYGADIKVKEK